MGAEGRNVSIFSILYNVQVYPQACSLRAAVFYFLYTAKTGPFYGLKQLYRASDEYLRVAD